MHLEVKKVKITCLTAKIGILHMTLTFDLEIFQGHMFYKS